MTSRQLKVLTFTTLYPSSVRPRHGIFVQTRLEHLARRTPIEVRVVAPVPWFPFMNQRFGEYAKLARTPRHEERLGFKVWHPRYAMVPGMGMYFQPYALVLGAYLSVRSLQRDGFDFDVIDAHYFYPDGVAAALLARWFKRPLVITARGTDVNLLPHYAVPRRLILWAARQAAAVITVSGALKRQLEELGVDPEHIRVIRNGVDQDVFIPDAAGASRRALGLPAGPLALSVGNLVPEKGHDVVIRAMRLMAGVHLAIVGEGPERECLERVAADAGVRERVSFLPVRPQRELAAVYGSADVLVLGSSREGWPNVLLEAMACGTPVVASDVGGVREIVTSPEAGIVLPARTPEAIAAAVRELMSKPQQRIAVRAYAERFSWDAVAGELADLLQGLTRDSTSERARATGAVV